MLKLSVLPHVNGAVFGRDHLIYQLRALRAGRFALTIDNETVDAEMRDRIKPVIESELLKRLAKVNEDLGTFGIDISE